MSKANAKYSFVDLFAGIGGFHAALAATGGVCEYAVEIDREAAAVYERNWNKPALGDITDDANDEGVTLRGYDGPIDVLTGGFPCQPFSKSGAQHGMAETRGTLFWNIARIIEEREPTVLILENVRNLVGPRHRHEWLTIIETLRFFGYEVSGAPAIFSPHLLPAWMGGTPQVRERVFITATLVPERMRDERIPRTETGEIDAEAIGPKPVATMNDRFPIKKGGTELFHPGDRKSGWNLLTSGSSVRATPSRATSTFASPRRRRCGSTRGTTSSRRSAARPEGRSKDSRTGQTRGPTSESSRASS